MKNIIPIAAGKALNTAEDVRGYFFCHGIAANAWAREHGFSRNSVKNLLCGRGKGANGQSHKIAIALGMKIPPDDSIAVAVATYDQNLKKRAN